MNTFIRYLIVIVLASAAVAVGLLLSSLMGNTPKEVPTTSTSDVEAYVREHINELSPQKAVLGGTFYVTAIAAHDGIGIVTYEDGHIALTAHFTYEKNGDVIIIPSFVVLSDNEQTFQNASSSEPAEQAEYIPTNTDSAPAQ